MYHIQFYRQVVGMDEARSDSRFVKITDFFLKKLDCFLFSVDLASKKAYCFLFSVDRAFIVDVLYDHRSYAQFYTLKTITAERDK